MHWFTILAGHLLTVGLTVQTPAVGPAQAITQVAIDDLAPGTFLWPDVGATSGLPTIVVDLPRQRAYLYRGSALAAVTTISTGRRGFRTPTGGFAILEKAATHRSRKYGNAPMPHMQRLTAAGVAIHGGEVPSYPASHGCIRVPPIFAERLFAVTRLGDIVVVTNDAAPPQITPEARAPM